MSECGGVGFCIAEKEKLIFEMSDESQGTWIHFFYRSLYHSTHVLALARVQIDVRVGKENLCDKKVKNRQMSLKVPC